MSEDLGIQSQTKPWCKQLVDCPRCGFRPSLLKTTWTDADVTWGVTCDCGCLDDLDHNTRGARRAAIRAWNAGHIIHPTYSWRRLDIRTAIRTGGRIPFESTYFV